MSAPARGMQFEREIREQPAVWERVAAGDRAERLARLLSGRIVLVGSGSSLFVAQLGALALRRRRIDAVALAATEARLDHAAYEDATVATAALLLWAASLAGGDGRRDAAALRRIARDVWAWLARAEGSELERAAARIAACRSVVVLGSDYGLPIANEMALKLKEACYLHAEGFASGEFRHGSIAMVDAASAVVGIVDRDSQAIVARPLAEVRGSGAQRFTIGACSCDDVERLGPELEVPFNTLGWLVTAQLVALYAARARGIDCDAPRGLRKALAGRE